MFLNVLYFTSLFLTALTENVGWKSYLTENPIEFHDIPLVWEKGSLTSVPNWLTGIYARNGPGQVQMLKAHRVLEGLFTYQKNSRTLKHAFFGVKPYGEQRLLKVFCPLWENPANLF